MRRIIRLGFAASFVLLGRSACPKEHIRISSAQGGNESFDVIVTDPSSSDITHCSRIWPNEKPEIIIIPAPPGCLVYGMSAKKFRLNDHLPMHIPQQGYIRYIPENELLDADDPFAINDVSCARILSVTNTKTKRIIVGEKCSVSETCRKPRLFKASSSSCSVDEEPTEFLESAGQHRTLGASLHLETNRVAFQWLPRQFFADPDELARKTHGKATSVTDSINIENPAWISPPQIVKVDRFPLPVHARVTPPKRGELFFTSYIPKAVWAVPVGTNHCAVEKGNLANLVKLDNDLRLSFMEDFAILRTSFLKGARHSSAEIPSGNPDDVMLTVLITATTAVAGALAIIIASLRK